MVETGTHKVLMEKKGLYFDLVDSQVFVDVEETGTKANSIVSHSDVIALEA